MGYVLPSASAFVLVVALTAVVLQLSAWAGGVPISHAARSYGAAIAFLAAKWFLIGGTLAWLCLYYGHISAEPLFWRVLGGLRNVGAAALTLDLDAIWGALRTLFAFDGLVILGAKTGLAVAILGATGVLAGVLLGAVVAIPQRILALRAKRLRAAAVTNQHPHGLAPFIKPDDAASQLAGDRRWAIHGRRMVASILALAARGPKANRRR